MPRKTSKNNLRTREKAKAPTNDNGASYTAKDIYVLEGLEPVRKRPGMYIGSTGTDGLHHLIWEVVDNSIDEAMAGFAKNITVELLPKSAKGGQVAVTDDGRGIPVEMHQQTKKSALETVMTTLHAGGKFGGESYKVAGGLHGVGVSVVNALSEWLRVEVCRDAGLYIQEYIRGKPKAKVKKTGSCSQNGTKVIFSPDPEIFSTIEFNEKRILDHLRQQAYLTKGVRINFFDWRKPPGSFYGFFFEGGVLSFVKYLAKDEKQLQDEIFYIHKQTTAARGEDNPEPKASRNNNTMEVEAAFVYVDDIDTKELSFANNIYTPDGGMHLTGFRSALTRTLNNYARAEGYLKEKDENLTSDDVREGLVAVVSLKLREPQFEGQTKARLGNPEARTVVEAVISEALKEFLEKRPQEARKIIEKVILAAKARLAAKAAKETVLRKGALEGLTLPGKLADCTSRHAEESELFIVEGDSAGGCFSGKTKVALVDGRNLSFGELLKEEKNSKTNFCYTIQNNGRIGIAPIKNVRLTKKHAEVIQITLDNNEKIVCTPDHKFMLSNRTYKEGHNLTEHDSLMALYRKHSKIGGKITIEGYEMVFDPSARFWIFTHLLSDQYNLKNGRYVESNKFHRHHKDFNKLNNHPDNLVRLNKEEHLKIHRELAYKTLRRSDVLEKIRLLHKTPQFREKIRQAMLKPAMRQLLSERAKKQWQNKDYKTFMINKFLEFYRTNAEYRKKSRERLNQAQREYWSNPGNVLAQAKRVKKYFENNPERRGILRGMALEQWQNSKLKKWRSRETEKQWTADFRERRKITYNRTYQHKALKALHNIYLKTNNLDVDAYENLRRKTNDKNLLRFETILTRFFGGDRENLESAVKLYNHRIKSVKFLEKRVDVYDLEVPETHNFALASGVFVHNSAKSGRDRRIQAILPVKGKILNVEKARLDKMLANQEIRSLVVALGTAIAENFDLEKLRYHKIILMSDADVDGAHIRTLFLTLFYRYFPQIIERGHLYIAQPPLYLLQRGKEVRYAYSEPEKDRIVKELGKSQKKSPEEVLEAEKENERGKIAGLTIQRYKGLGEMNPEQLWETTMNPEKRILKQVTIEDAEKANRLFNVLMGDLVEPRKQFIQAYAAEVRNLDI